MNKNFLPLNLQFFAEGESQAEQQPQTLDELLNSNKDYQSAFDKKISKSLETAKTKWMAEYEQKLADAKTEAEKLSKMKAEEKAKYELDKKMNELTEREKALNLRELKSEAQSQLTDAGLSKDFLDLLNFESADTVKHSIDTLKATFQTALEKAVNERLGDNEAPKRGQSSGEDPEIEKLKKIMGI